MLRFKDPIICTNCETYIVYLHECTSIMFRKDRIWIHCGECGFNNFNRIITEEDIIREEKQKEV